MKLLAPFLAALLLLPPLAAAPSAGAVDIPDINIETVCKEIASRRNLRSPATDLCKQVQGAARKWLQAQEVSIDDVRYCSGLAQDNPAAGYVLLKACIQERVEGH